MRAPGSMDVEEERRRARQVRLIVDLTCALIAQGRPERLEAEKWVEAARARILTLFPGGDDTYEIVCAPRFRRVIDEFSRPDSRGGTGTVLPFSARSPDR